MTRLRRSTVPHYFTLIEMLVVIAIIALLAAILLPALRRALREAHEVVCMNNIHQLVVASIAYKEEYSGYYPPPVVILTPGDWSRAHPHDLKASDIGYIAPYIGEDPRRFDDLTPMQESQVPRTLRCPFGNFQLNTNIATWDAKNASGQSVTSYFYTGYGYFGRLEWLLPGYKSITSVPEDFKRKYADRRCDPDAALWGDAVTWMTYWGFPTGGYTHTFSGRPRNLWDGEPGVDFRYFERQNLGRVDGSVRIRWPSEVNPVPSNSGLNLGGEYRWWYY